jgi:hypoxanthine phosphoribosyltransferase
MMLVDDSLDERQTMDLLRDSLAKWNLEDHLNGAMEYINEFRKDREWIKNGTGLSKYISEVRDNIKDLGKILEEFSKQ